MKQSDQATKSTNVPLRAARADSSRNTLTVLQELELARSINRDHCPIARAILMESNELLVVAIAERFSGRGVAIKTLIDEGKLGLEVAVDGFDCEQGVRFSTYASWWIKQAMKRFVIECTRSVPVTAS